MEQRGTVNIMPDYQQASEQLYLFQQNSVYHAAIARILQFEIYQLPSYNYVVDTGRKRTLFHCKWVNSNSYISIEITRFSVSLNQ